MACACSMFVIWLVKTKKTYQTKNKHKPMIKTKNKEHTPSKQQNKNNRHEQEKTSLI
jgi:hypothetical protein